MSNKFEATFHPGGEPLPRREPFATLASFDRTARPAEPVPPVDSDEAYLSPGRPPWEPEEPPFWPVALTIAVVAGFGVGMIITVIFALF